MSDVWGIKSLIEKAVEERTFELAKSLLALFAWLQFRGFICESMNDEDEEEFLQWCYQNIPQVAAVA